MRSDWKLEPITRIVRHIGRKAYFAAFQPLARRRVNLRFTQARV